MITLWNKQDPRELYDIGVHRNTALLLKSAESKLVSAQEILTYEPLTG